MSKAERATSSRVNTPQQLCLYNTTVGVMHMWSIGIWPPSLTVSFASAATYCFRLVMNPMSVFDLSPSSEPLLVIRPWAAVPAALTPLMVSEIFLFTKPLYSAAQEMKSTDKHVDGVRDLPVHKTLAKDSAAQGTKSAGDHPVSKVCI